MEGTYDYFKQIGKTIEDPPVVVWLERYPDRKFGLNDGQITPGEVAEYLLMRVGDVPFGDAREVVHSQEPTVVANVHGAVTRYNAATGETLDGE